MKTQSERILEYMKTHDGITSMEAFEHIGCTRLSARIYDLVEKGHSIDADYDIKDGKKQTYFRYRLLKENVNG